jgi:hypothetical protein
MQFTVLAYEVVNVIGQVCRLAVGLVDVPCVDVVLTFGCPLHGLSELLSELTSNVVLNFDDPLPEFIFRLHRVHVQDTAVDV